MRKMLTLFLLALTTLLVSCNTQSTTVKEEEKTSKRSLSDFQLAYPSMIEIQEGDFIYRLVTDQQEYAAKEPVALYAELEYIGEKEEATIYHAASPFYFNMEEKTRNYLIEYAMNEPLISTTLKKGEPLRENYSGSGGFSEQDDPDYIAFLKDLWENGFPEGYYVIDGFVDFYEENAEGKEKTVYRFGGKVDFKVNQ